MTAPKIHREDTKRMNQHSVSRNLVFSALCVEEGCFET
jgi:hypothetical protein